MRIEYREIEVPEGEQANLKTPAGAQITVLGVDRREGEGIGNWRTVFRVALVWK